MTTSEHEPPAINRPNNSSQNMATSIDPINGMNSSTPPTPVARANACSLNPNLITPVAPNEDLITPVAPNEDTRYSSEKGEQLVVSINTK